MTPEEIAAWEPFLKRIPLFAGLSSADISRIADRIQTLSLPKGSTLYMQGDEPDALYVITSGQVRVVARAGGVEKVTAFLGPGETIGEGGMLTGEPRTQTIRLNTTCEFLKLPRKDFEEVLRETPTILLHLSRILTRRLVETSHPSPGRVEQSSQLIAVNAALSRPDRLLLTLHLGLQLTEQTRRRVLIVDMKPDSGNIARALGLEPRLITEKTIREVNLHDPGLLRALSQQHASGIEVLSLPAATLGGRLFSGIYLFLNFLREVHDLVLVSLGENLGDVEKTVLAEADQVLLAGSDAFRPQFRQLEAELLSLLDAQRLLRVWLGEMEVDETVPAAGPARVMIPWPQAIADEFERDGSPYRPLEAHPKSRLAVERLARRLSGAKVGLALSAGAALGLSLVGILKVFKKEHIPVDIVGGTSIGSLVGGLLALGLEPEEIEDIAVRTSKGWIYENLFLDLTLPRSGLFAGETMLRFIRSYFGAREFSDLEIPFACVAADIETGEEVVLREGRVAEAIRASCGLPLIFAPIRLGGRYLVDGGLVNPVPTSIIADMGADVLIAVDLTMPVSERKTRTRPGGAPQAKAPLLQTPVDLSVLRDLAVPEMLKAPNMFKIFFQMIYTMEYEISQARTNPAHVVIHPDLKGFSWTEMHRGREFVRAGEAIAEEYVPQIKALLPIFSDRSKAPLRLASPWKP